MSADPIATLSEAMQAVVDDLRAELAMAKARIARLEAAQVTPSMLDAALIEGSAVVGQHGVVEAAPAPRPPAGRLTTTAQIHAAAMAVPGVVRAHVAYKDRVWRCQIADAEGSCSLMLRGAVFAAVAPRLGPMQTFLPVAWEGGEVSLVGAAERMQRQRAAGTRGPMGRVWGATHERGSDVPRRIDPEETISIAGAGTYDVLMQIVRGFPGVAGLGRRDDVGRAGTLEVIVEPGHDLEETVQAVRDAIGHMLPVGISLVAVPQAAPPAPVAAPASPGRFRVGQRVRVTRPQNRAERRRQPGWMSDMDIYDGAECTLTVQTDGGWWKLAEDPTMWDFHPDWLTPIETPATAPEAQAVPFDEVGVAYCCALPPEQRRAYREIRRWYVEGDCREDRECKDRLEAAGLDRNTLNRAGPLGYNSWIARYFGEPDALARLDADEREEERRANL